MIRLLSRSSPRYALQPAGAGEDAFLPLEFYLYPRGPITEAQPCTDAGYPCVLSVYADSMYAGLLWAPTQPVP